MTGQLKPWAYGPFEILLHAELHYRATEDFDRRIAMISFDNAVEVAISTYLDLHPLQRGNRAYVRADVDKWLINHHSKLDFFFGECERRETTPTVTIDEAIWFHRVRNDQYHGGGANVPPRRALDGARSAAYEIFSILFEEPDVELLVEEHIAGMGPIPPPERTGDQDRIIDAAHGMIDVCGQAEYTSEVLYALDPTRYVEVATDLRATLDGHGREETVL